MNKKIIFITSEKCKYLFSLTGFRQFIAHESATAAKIIDEISGDDTIGAIFIEETVFNGLDDSYKYFLEKRWDGIVAKIPSPSLWSEESYILKLINRALGYQVKII